ncbi:MAG: hypothetical protein ACI934_001535, partial [Pseudohongiellaceae bacterium]
MTNSTTNKVMTKVMNKLQLVLLLSSTILLMPSANAALYVTIVQGLGGLPEYDD